MRGLVDGGNEGGMVGGRVRRIAGKGGVVWGDGEGRGWRRGLLEGGWLMGKMRGWWGV